MDTPDWIDFLTCNVRELGTKEQHIENVNSTYDQCLAINIASANDSPSKIVATSCDEKYPVLCVGYKDEYVYFGKF